MTHDEDEAPLKIKIKYFSDIDKIKSISIGDWIDLRSAETIEFNAGDFYIVKLGVAMQLPNGYEAHIVPRSSLFKNYNILQTNGMAVIDNSYCGDNDQWVFPAYAVKKSYIRKNDRICQFRIVKKQPDIEFVEVKSLGNKDRNGLGSTGKN